MDNPNNRYRVYLIECYPIHTRDNITRFIKIGISKNVKRRLQSLQHSSPFILETIVISPVLDHNAKRLEKWLHDQFAEHRLKGEWFCLVDDNVVQTRNFLGDESLVDKLEYFRFIANHSKKAKDEWKDKILDPRVLDKIWEDSLEDGKPKRDYLFLN